VAKVFEEQNWKWVIGTEYRIPTASDIEDTLYRLIEAVSDEVEASGYREDCYVASGRLFVNYTVEGEKKSFSTLEMGLEFIEALSIDLKE
jgi:hypothetical protein